MVADLRGRPWRPGAIDFVAANTAVHRELLALLRV